MGKILCKAQDSFLTCISWGFLECEMLYSAVEQEAILSYASYTLCIPCVSAAQLPQLTGFMWDSYVLLFPSRDRIWNGGLS